MRITQDLPQVSDWKGSTKITQDLQKNPGPVRAIAELSKIRQGLFRTADCVFQLGQFVAKGYQQLSVSLSLERWERQDASNIVSVWRLFLLQQERRVSPKWRICITARTNLGEIADDVSASFVDFTEDVKEEGLDVKIERLVVQEEFGQETEILSINLVLFPICFINGQCPLPVYLFAWWLPPCTFSLWSIAIMLFRFRNTEDPTMKHLLCDACRSSPVAYT